MSITDIVASSAGDYRPYWRNFHTAWASSTLSERQGQRVNRSEAMHLRETLAKSPELWQYSLLDSDALCRYANEHGIRIFSGETIVSLWRAGILRADIVVAKIKRDVRDLVTIDEDQCAVFYCDARQVEARQQGFGGVLRAVRNACGS
jgi:hypothetical protein